MANKTLSLTFSIEGSFITRTAREWFYYEHKPYKIVEELLLSCMCGTDIPIEELKRMAQEVILGRAEFQGNSGDDTFKYVKLDNCANLNIFEQFGKLAQEKKELEKSYKLLNERFINLCDAINDCAYGDKDEALQEITNREDKKMFADMLRGLGERVSYSPQTGYAILDDYLEASKTKDNYGWLSPTGEFFPVAWCCHQEWADKKINELGLRDEYKKWSDTTNHICGMWGDFLCEKGWILLHSPSQGTAIVSRNEEKRITKVQSEFLFGYYTDRGKHDLAKQYLI